MISCDGRINPVSISLSHPAPGYCVFEGLELQFADTCSYDFVIGFLSGFDSVTVTRTLLGGTLYLFADSGDFSYWNEYFKNDSAIQYISTAYTSSDSLILKLVLTGKKSIDKEKESLSKIKNLTIIKFEETPKLVYVDVPENNISGWMENFRKYQFILQVMLIGVCVN